MKTNTQYTNFKPTYEALEQFYVDHPGLQESNRIILSAKVKKMLNSSKPLLNGWSLEMFEALDDVVLKQAN